MDNNTFMGFLIAAIVVLIGLATGVTTLIIKPILNLTKSITKLEISIDNLNTSVLNTENSLKNQEKDINDINKDLRAFDVRVSKIEEARKI